MKTHIIILLFVMSLFTACNEDVYISPYKGEAYMDWAGEKVEYVAGSYNIDKISNKFTLGLDHGSTKGYGHCVSFNHINPNKTYNFVKVSFGDEIDEETPSSLLFLGCGDHVDGWGKVLLSEGNLNYVKITSYNLTTKEVRGEFQMSYLADRTVPYRSLAPDTVRIKNGTFFVKLE